MQYRYCESSPEHFATNLRRDSFTGNLMWDNARGQDVLIIQTPYGQNPCEQMEAICDAMGRQQPAPGAFHEILPGTWVRFMTAADKTKYNGCPLNGEASSYTVFGVSASGDACSIYAPQNTAMITSVCDIPVEMKVVIAAQTKLQGMLWKKQEAPTGFFTIDFPAGAAPGYVDGDLVYEIDRLQIPITKRMLEQRTVYVKSAARPTLVSRNKGLKLV